jgi:hypothetical protein
LIARNADDEAIRSGDLGRIAGVRYDGRDLRSAVTAGCLNQRMLVQVT